GAKTPQAGARKWDSNSMNTDTKLKIAVFASATGPFDPETLEKSREIGALIANHGHTLITGGCPGIPHEAARAAHENNGKTIAYSPARDIEEHKELSYPTDCTSEFIFIPEEYSHAKNHDIYKKYRNVSSVRACDAAIIISGKIGTLNEFTIAYDLGKTIGILEGTGGITQHLKQLIADLNKKTNAKIIYSKEPKELIANILEALK
ncbi:MAG: hypothetical protein U9Q92_01910, partial [archaeon]|nr:hypothetical protein [archaeon]